MNTFFQWFKCLFGRGNVQSFTFYIPSPPERKTGYREKQFDTLFYKFINMGFKIEQFKTVPNSNPNHSGMWIVCVLRATTPAAENLDLSSFFNDEYKPDGHNLETTETDYRHEGIFIIND